MENPMTTLPPHDSLENSESTCGIALCEMQDGTLRILRYGIPFDNHSWRQDEMHLAQLKLEELKLRIVSDPEFEGEMNEEQPNRRIPLGYGMAAVFGLSVYQQLRDV
jgi:hypothetical protein